MIGIGGSSMSGLALMLNDLGYIVTGSDESNSYTLSALHEKGIKTIVGHDPLNLGDAELVVYTAAVPEINPERIAATNKGIPQIERKILLGQLMENYDKSICICGTHGKTTTTGMVAKTLLDCGFNPSVHIGGSLGSIGGSTRLGSLDYFVAEACEFNASFFSMYPDIAIVLNIKEDHLDFYKDIDDIENSFRTFLANLSEDGIAIGCGDDERVKKLLLEKKNYVTFGFEKDNDCYPINIEFLEDACARFDIVYKGKIIANLKLNVPGRVQIIDALAAFLTAYILGAKCDEIVASLSHFEGVKRRFEHTGTYEGVKVYNDYGHNPEETHQVVETANMLPHNKLWVVIQPHTFTRVKKFFNDYVHCADLADKILFTDIFASREKDPGDISSNDIVLAMKERGLDAYYTPSFEDALKLLVENWEEGDIVITLGGGDINKLNIAIDDYFKE
ncbi:MAG: UDP-N-acetylmuramate--L-alanine ligase [Eubacteriales bacterium]|nr:UDP-N-acetylmuramate--L-alanine ligase [Eubacteriales bacterium]